jgi:hypothetical protein
MDDLKRYTAGVVLTALLLGCGDSTAPGNPGEGGNPNPPPPPVLLQDIVIPNLPSPYYHFEYDAAGRVRTASFASGFTMYQVIYQGERISELRNNTLGNQDRLVYLYDVFGRVSEVSYVRPDNTVSTRVRLSYDGEKLTGLERKRQMAGSFVIDKTMSFSYYPDGNLQELTEHRPLIEGFQPATTTVDRFEQYDAGINVDGFGLIHNDFFDHLVLLPGVVLQKGNPARVTHTGDGDNYTVDNVYTYDDRNRPLTSVGDLVFLNGSHAGQHFRTQSSFTYY